MADFSFLGELSLFIYYDLV